MTCFRHRTGQKPKRTCMPENGKMTGRVPVTLILTATLLAGLLIMTGCRKTSGEAETEVPTEGTEAVSTGMSLHESDTDTPRDETVPEETEPGETVYFDDGIRDTTETTAAAETGAHRVFRQNFDRPVSPSDPDWFANEAADFSDGHMTSKGKTHFYLAEKHKVSAEKAVVSLRLQARRPNAPPHDAGFVGLRVSNFDNQFNAVGNTGIWLAFQNDRVGIIATWPNVPLFKIPFSFASPSIIRIEDDRASDIISVFAETEGKDQLLFRVIIEEQRHVALVDADGKTCGTYDFSYDIEKEGFVCFWAHQNDGGVVYDDISVEWDEVKDTAYVPGSPTDIRDLYSDSWTGTDGVGRPVHTLSGTVDDKLVGIFYEIWHVSTHVTYPDQLLYDHNAIYQEKGLRGVMEAYDQGPLGWGHWWAEPYFGYYLNTDRWIIRKHASMLSDIGVDFIYLDVTNGNPFTNVYKTIFKEYRAMRDEGMDTPDICFFLSDSAQHNEKVFQDLWDNLYSVGRYRDLYCMYEGKPLILGNLSLVDKEKAETFTVRRCWALKENLGDGKDYWNWMCETPQVASYHSQTGQVEEISISAGILANLSIGRSYTMAGKQPPLLRLPDGSIDKFQFNLPTTAYGPLFREQMERASEVDPYVLLVTGWNEWTAGRWEADRKGMFIANTDLSFTNSYYVDAFNPEFSRDIEPMKGGFGDNYYYQLAAFLREFKGSRTLPPASGQKEIRLDGDLTQWESVFPEYRDTCGDTFHRDSIGFGGFHHYTNESGRNDFVTVKVSSFGEYTYFLAMCADPITAPEGDQWMNLFLDSDLSSETGWAGYDFRIGATVTMTDAHTGYMSVEKFTGDAFQSVPVGKAEIRLDGACLVVKVPDALCGLTGDFDFKWADHSVPDGDVMQFLDQGDAAPNARFNYAFRRESGEVRLNNDLKPYLKEGAGYRVGSSYLISGDRLHPLDAASSAASAEYHRNRICVPAGSLAGVDGLTVTVQDDGRCVSVTYRGKTAVFREGETAVPSGADTVILPVAPYLSGGRLYIPLNAAAFILGWHYVSDEAGTVLITSEPVTQSGESLARLMRALGRSV